MIKDDKLPVKIFRFTATISDDVSKRNTEGRHLTLYFTFIEFDSNFQFFPIPAIDLFSELITKMLEKTNKDIEGAKSQNVLKPTSEKKSLKDLTANSNSHQFKIFEQNLLISSIKKSAEARYKMVQTRRNDIEISVDKSAKNEDQTSDIELAVGIKKSRIDHKDSDMIHIGFGNLYQLYDVEQEESKTENCSKYPSYFKSKTNHENDR